MKILVADDDTAIRGLISIMLTTSGFEVVAVQNGREALEMFPKEDFILVITDKNMPELDGLSLAKKLREQNKFIKIILASADEELSLQHIDAVISKPFSREALIKVVNTVLSA